MAALPEGVLDDFEKITRYPIKEFLVRYATFISNNRADILDYYSGVSKRPRERSFAALRELLKDIGRLNDLVDIHSNRLRGASFWELSELLMTIDTTLQTIDNSSKWLRSAITKNNFNPSIETNYTLQKLQTLEQVSGNVLGSTNRDGDWVRIALRNSLNEEAYTPAGGNLLVVSGQGVRSIQLRSVVDNIYGERVYGRDVDRKLTFVDDDLKVLSYKETIKQTVEILSTMTQGKTPEFPSNGIQASLVRGSNLSSIAHPILIRQIYQTFKQDDTLQALTITSINTDQDSLSLELEVETRLGDVINQTVTI